MSTAPKTTAPVPAWPAPPRSWTAVTILLLAYSLSYADRMMMSLLIQPIKADLGISDVQVSLLIGFAFALFYVAMGIPFGTLADRVNRRNLIAFGILAWSVATGLCGLAGSFVALFLARMAVGAGEATLTPAAYSLISDHFPRERLGRAMSVYVIGGPLGTGLALTLGSLFIAAVTSRPVILLPIVGEIASWRLVFLGLIVPGVIVSLLVMTIREPARRGVQLSPERAPRRWNDGLRFIRAHLATYVSLIGGAAFLAAAVFGSMAWIPTFFIRTHGLTAAQAGWTFGLILGVAGATGLVIGGIAGDAIVRRGRIDGHLRVMAWAAALAVIPYVAAPLVPDPRIAFVLLAIGILGTGATSGVSATTIQLVTPGYLRGQVTAVYILMTSIVGIGLGPTAVAALTDYAFADEAMLRYSLSLVALVTLPLAALLLFVGLPNYRSAVMGEGSAA